MTSGTIVVGVDGSTSAARALTWAVEEAVAEHRALTLVHAVSASAPGFIGAGIVEASNARILMEQDGRSMLAEARATVQRAVPTVVVEECFELLDPREALLRPSATAAMVVVGSRGRGHVRGTVLGSVSVSLVRHAHCPVVVVRPGNRGTVRNGILLGLDPSPESRPVLEFAYREAAIRNLPLTVVNCGWDGEGDCLAVADSLAGMAEKYPEVRVITRLMRGASQSQLIRFAERMDLVVLGRHQDERMSQLHRSVPVAVVEGVTCPVAVVPVSPAP